MSPPSPGHISVPANRSNRRTHQREGNDQDGRLHRLRQGGILHQEEDTQEHENCGLNVMLVSITIHYRVPIGLYPPITELPIGGSFDLHIRQQLVNSGNPRFQLEEPIRYSRFEWGRRFVPNASLSLVPSLNPSSNLF